MTIRSFLLMCFLATFACAQSPVSQEATFAAIQTKFLKAWSNSQPVDVKPYYWENAGLFSNGVLIQYPDSISNQWSALLLDKPPLSSSRSLQLLPHDSTRFFDMGYYQSGASKTSDLAYVIAWIEKKQEWKRELEIVYPITASDQEIPVGIDEARQKWVVLSNAQDHQRLVQELYTTDATYFTDGKIYRGIPEISERYQYMSDPQWHIELYAQKVLSVQDDLVYEIGEYHSGGKGHYVIVWQKQTDGNWQVLLDFNF